MSVNNFYREREVKKIIKDQFDEREFKAALLHDKPKKLFHHHYSTKTPCFHAEGYSEEGITGYFDNWADKTPMFHPWEDFYKSLRIQDLTQWFYI